MSGQGKIIPGTDEIYKEPVAGTEENEIVDIESDMFDKDPFDGKDEEAENQDFLDNLEGNETRKAERLAEEETARLAAASSGEPAEKKFDTMGNEIVATPPVSTDDDPNKLDFTKKPTADETEDVDLAKMNKLFSKEFKSQKEFADFANAKKAGEDTTIEDDLFEKATDSIAVYDRYLGMNDQALVRENLKQLAVNDGKDVNDEFVAQEIEEEIQVMEDSRTLALNAKSVRTDLENAKKLSQADIQGIEAKRTERKEAATKSRNEILEGAVVEFWGKENFYGVKLDKQSVYDTLEDVKTGKFIEDLQKDPKALVEIALLTRNRKHVYQKSTGLSYSDGIKAMTKELGDNSGRGGIIPNGSRNANGGAGGVDDDEEFMRALLK